MERVISDECLEEIKRQCYEAGRKGRERFTVREPDGPEIVRCRSCKYFSEFGDTCRWFAYQENAFSRHLSFVSPDGFCAWVERRENL